MDLRRTSPLLTQEQKLTVVTLAQAKMQARVSHGFEDDLIKGYIEAAYDFLSGPVGWLSNCYLLTETFELYLPSWSPICRGPWGYALRHVEIPARPFASVTAFGSLQEDGRYADVAASAYAVTREEGAFASLVRVGGGAWPYSGPATPLAYRLTFTAGYGLPAAIPSVLKQSILLLVAEFYDNRTAAAEKVRPQTQFGLQKLAGQYRLAKDHS